MKKSNDELNDTPKVLGDDAKRKREDRRYYRNLILRSVATFVVGSILCSFFESGGLCGGILGLLLCFCSFVFAKSC